MLFRTLDVVFQDTVDCVGPVVLFDINVAGRVWARVYWYLNTKRICNMLITAVDNDTNKSMDAV
jgi:hypothetical protein